MSEVDPGTEATALTARFICRAAARGAKRALLVGDLPFGSYLTPDDATRNAVRLAIPPR